MFEPIATETERVATQVMDAAFMACPVTFEAGDDGQITGLVIHQGGQDLKAAKVKKP